MKKFCLLILASTLILSLLLTSCVTTEKTQTPEELWDLVKEAYIYTFPLVLMDATKTAGTNTETAVPGKAPVNQFMHGVKTANASFKTVVTPNVDTVYTQTWLDLSEEPIIYVKPAADRFFKVQVLDAWTNTVTSMVEEGVYAFCLPSWKGTLPEGVKRIDVPTAMVWTICRTILYSEEDLVNVRAIQNAMQLMPLSAYVAGVYEAPKGTYSPENDFVPINKVLSLGPKAFFDKANELMVANPPAKADKALLKKFAAINVGPGMTFDLSVLSGDIATTWKTMLQGLKPTLLAGGDKFYVGLGQWRYLGAPIGDFGTEYLFRAMVALGGLGANTVEIALYPRTAVDSDGNQLTGEHDYIMHFDSFPPVLDGGFWSITAYGEDNFLIDNPLDRYSVNDRSGLILNADGSADVLLSKNQPEDITNWLPVCDEAFHLYMRIYTPDMEAIGTWNPPVINIVK